MKEIEEGNFLISKFMGYSYTSADNVIFKASHKVLHNYHENWNKLMPVVEKINNIAIDDFGEIDVTISGIGCFIGNGYDDPIISIPKENKTLISTVWQAVTEFINWYNSLSSNKK